MSNCWRLRILIVIIKKYNIFTTLENICSSRSFLLQLNTFKILEYFNRLEINLYENVQSSQRKRLLNGAYTFMIPS